VDTANKLQGREFDFCVCWHPMAGLDEADEFHLESGRLCVMCTRHRHACVVIGRAGDRELVEGPPPATPAWPGAELDHILSGWEVQQNVFAKLGAFRLRKRSVLLFRFSPTVNRTVAPRHPPNAGLRTREYLTVAEVERLLRATKGNRWLTGTAR
jgi:hypothetical protein